MLKEWAVWEIMKGDEVNIKMQGHTVLLRHFPGTFRNVIPKKGNFDLGEYSLVSSNGPPPLSLRGAMYLPYPTR